MCNKTTDGAQNNTDRTEMCNKTTDGSQNNTDTTKMCNKTTQIELKYSD